MSETDKDRRIRVLVAVERKDANPYGYILDWTGGEWAARTFADEVNIQSRICEDVCLANPSEAGVWQFFGHMWYPDSGDPEDSEPEFSGNWSLLWPLPEIAP